MRAASLSCCSLDLYPKQNLSFVGGYSINFAIQAKAAGAEIGSIVGAVGDDLEGLRIKRHLEHKQIDISHLYDTYEETPKILREGDSLLTMNRNDRQNMDKDPLQVDLTEADWAFLFQHELVHTHVSDPHYDDFLDHIIEDSFPLVDFSGKERWGELEKGLKKGLRVVFCDWSKDVLPRLQDLSCKYDAVLILDTGDEGTLACFDTEVTFQKAAAVKNIIDRNGFNEAYLAAFCLEWFTSGQLRHAMKLASQAAARVSTFFGGNE